MMLRRDAIDTDLWPSHRLRNVRRKVVERIGLLRDLDPEIPGGSQIRIANACSCLEALCDELDERIGMTIAAEDEKVAA